ncbi:aldo/keto reductase [Aquimarina sp. MMG015]|uniref:aldo/keto reductase n=1 Tax=Aquimarina sp. MMG015 TaxID=2822689 RepID=UPI001B3A45DC|nr:aldo/keto reductase [Aquimarina sp. MMG015]MBQ4801423.1 aldo/keto reductase [Aquimarina sp. MMG015]
MTDKLILGTVQLGLDYGINNQSGKPSLKTAFDILHIAYDNGIRVLDTAEAYGNSQEVIGKFHKDNPKKTFNVITKLDPGYKLENKDLLSRILKSCEILETKELFGYMFHNYQSFKKNTDSYDKILHAKSKRIIKKAGISLYTNAEIEDIISNYSDFDFIQIPFNLFDNQSKRKELLEKAKNAGIEIHTRSVFLQGLFFKDSTEIPNKLNSLAPYLKTLENVKEKEVLNTETLALQYVLQKEYIDYVLIGVESSEQLQNNINFCKEKINIPHHKIDNIRVIEEELLNPSNWN